MNRGRAPQPERDCEFCGNPLPELRHPKKRYCDPVCRQRDKYQQQHAVDGIKCLDCGKVFTRVGSHAVQVHGYENTLDYRREHGLMARETRLDEHAAIMSAKASTIDNLKSGAHRRYVKGGDHPEIVREFWRNREQKLGHRKRKFQ